MTVPDACPTPEALRVLLDDTSSPAWGDVEPHLAGCKACQDVLERLTRPATAVAETFWTGPGDAPPPPDGETLAAAPQGPAKPPERLPDIPGYAVERVLGRGGMGVVYLARQANANRPVAVKMMPAGRASDEDLMRFRLEAENLARLRHPNIVRVYEAGAVDDRPFFSMEYVAGGSLADSLAKGGRTPAEAALLVEALARAVHAAHQCGVVHRDLKPANILIDDDADGSAPGVPKITDFGLAKRVGDDSGLTQTGQILGTPSYMAPEQASGRRAVGVPADVYALGAILYEALCGRPPFREGSPWETMMKVVHEPAPPPSRARPGLPRDLEVVALKCLAKAPEDRYASADALAEDLRRWREGLPIAARPAGPSRRAWLWARRHPGYAALGSLLFASVVAGVAGVAVQWRRAERHLAESQAHLEGSRRRLELAMKAIESFYTGTSTDVLLKRPELEELRASLLNTPLQFYRSLRDELEREGEPDRSTLGQLVEVLLGLGKLNDEVGREDDASEAYRQAAEAARRLLRDAPDAPSPRRSLARALRKSAGIDANSSQPDRARGALEEATALYDSLVREAPDDLALRDERADGLEVLGDIEGDQEHFEASERRYLESIAAHEALVARAPDEAEYLHHLGGAQNNLAILYAQWNRMDDAGRWFHEGLESRRKLAGRRGDVPEYMRSYGSGLNNYGSFLLNTNRATEVPPYFQEAREVQERLVRDHPTHGLYLDDLAVTHENTANYLSHLGQRDRSKAEHGRALVLRERLAADHPASFKYQIRLIQARSGLSVDHLLDREFGRARSEARAAVAAIERAAALHAAAPEFQQQYADALKCLGDVEAFTGWSGPAEAAYTGAMARLGGPNSGAASTAEVRLLRAGTLMRRGLLRTSVGRHEAGEADFHEALAAAEGLLAEQPELSRIRNMAASIRTYLADGSLDRSRRSGSRDEAAAAREVYTRAIEEEAALLREDPEDDDSKGAMAECLAGRARALELMGRPDEAEEDWDEAVATAPSRAELGVRLGRAAMLARAGRIDEALSVARTAGGIKPEIAGEAVARARVFAGAAAGPGVDRESLAAEAVSWLSRAACAPDRGDGLALLEMAAAAPDFDAIRDRPDFRAVLRDVPLPADPFAP